MPRRGLNKSARAKICGQTVEPGLLPISILLYVGVRQGQHSERINRSVAISERPREIAISTAR
jgi:hypothetical protein